RAGQPAHQFLTTRRARSYCPADLLGSPLNLHPARRLSSYGASLSLAVPSSRFFRNPHSILTLVSLSFFSAPHLATWLALPHALPLVTCAVSVASLLPVARTAPDDDPPSACAASSASAFARAHILPQGQRMEIPRVFCGFLSAQRGSLT